MSGWLWRSTASHGPNMPRARSSRTATFASSCAGAISLPSGILAAAEEPFVGVTVPGEQAEPELAEQILRSASFGTDANQRDRFGRSGMLCSLAAFHGFVLKIFLKLTRHLLHLGVLAQLLHLRIHHLILYAEMVAHFLKHLDHFRRLFLSQQIDLQVEMATLIGFLAHTGLADEHE